ncbi:MAG: hypothetical protein QXG41_09690 [Candidatus Caldarchaeum sp.]
MANKRIQTTIDMFAVGQTILCDRCGCHKVDEECRCEKERS